MPSATQAPERGEDSALVPGASTEVSFHARASGAGVGRLIAEKDWSATPLGPAASWPRCLKNHVAMVIELRTPAIIFWGPQHTQLYNDGYAEIMGPRHPQHLGSTFRECWPEAYDAIEPWMQRVLTGGQNVEVERALIHLTRYGFTEEAYFTFTFSPLWDDAGAIAGVLQLVHEVTPIVLSERRSRVLHRLSGQGLPASTIEAAIGRATQVLGSNTADLPFAAIYLSGAQRLSLAGASGWAGAGCPLPVGVEPSIEAPTGTWSRSFAEAIRDRRLVRVDDPCAQLGPLPGGPWPEAPRAALISAIASADEGEVAGVLAAGVSPRLRVDAAYEEYVELIGGHLARMIGMLRALHGERERAAELERANRELEAFSYSVSHDLRAPLRGIDGFTRVVLGDHGERLGEEGRRHLERVRAAAQRMGQLIDDLLSLSRVGRSGLERQRVDLAALARSVLAELAARDPHREVETLISEPLVVEADAKLVRLLLENLLGNSWKFTAKRPAARIEVGRRGRELFVRDDGAGFDMQYANKLFTPFQRLHAPAEFEGTGIGLAIAQRVVARHGGRIRAEGVVGGGATFFFELEEQR